MTHPPAMTLMVPWRVQARLTRPDEELMRALESWLLLVAGLCGNIAPSFVVGRAP